RPGAPPGPAVTALPHERDQRDDDHGKRDRARDHEASPADPSHRSRIGSAGTLLERRRATPGATSAVLGELPERLALVGVRLLGQAQDPLTEDVVLDLVGAALDLG